MPRLSAEVYRYGPCLLLIHLQRIAGNLELLLVDLVDGILVALLDGCPLFLVDICPRLRYT